MKFTLLVAAVVARHHHHHDQNHHHHQCYGMICRRCSFTSLNVWSLGRVVAGRPAMFQGARIVAQMGDKKIPAGAGRSRGKQVNRRL